MLDLGRADAVRQRGKRAVRAGVRVATDHRHARQRGALLGPDDVHDALAAVGNVEVGQTILAGVVTQRLDLQTGHRIGDAFLTAGGGHVVVHHRQVGIQAPRRAVCLLQALEGLRTGDLMQQVTVDVQQAAAIGFLTDDMSVPQLVVKGTGSIKHPAIMPRRPTTSTSGKVSVPAPGTAAAPGPNSPADP